MRHSLKIPRLNEAFIIAVIVIIGMLGLKSQDDSNTITYIFLLFLLLAYFILTINKGYSFGISSYKAMLLVFPCVWVYGFLIGIVNGNNMGYVIRNFSGMLVYLLFFVLFSSRVKTETIIIILRYLSLLLLVATPISFFILFTLHADFLYNVPILNNFMTGVTESHTFTLQYMASNLIFIQYSISLLHFLKGRRIVNNIIVLILTVLTVFITGSSGILLEFLVFTLLVFLKAILSKVGNNKSLVVFFLILFGLLAVIAFFAVYDLSSSGIFAKDDYGNQVRYKQVDYILGNLTFFGKGLGASYSAIGSIYSVEIIYLDIIYKFGIFSLLLFGAYFVVGLKALFLFFGKNTKEGNEIIPLVLLGFLIFSLGNPNLFSVCSVFSHIFCVRLLMENSKKKSVETELVARSACV